MQGYNASLDEPLCLNTCLRCFKKIELQIWTEGKWFKKSRAAKVFSSSQVRNCFPS